MDPDPITTISEQIKEIDKAPSEARWERFAREIEAEAPELDEDVIRELIADAAKASKAPGRSKVAALACCMGSIGSARPKFTDEAIDAIEEILTHPSLDVKLAAVEALNSIKGDRAESILRKLIEEGREPLSSSASEALDSM